MRPDLRAQLSYVSDEYDRFGVRCGDATLHTVGGFHGNFVECAPRASKSRRFARLRLHV